MSSESTSTIGRSARRTRLGRGPLVAVLAAVALLASACGGGPGSREDFNEVLTRGGSLTPEEADCISGEVFDRYGDDDDSLGKLSAAPDLAFLEGEDGIDGFTEFFDSAVESCLQVGPSS